MSHLRRSEWIVDWCSQPQAREFLERVHYTGGCPRTAVARHVLRRTDSSEICGVALWLPPTRVAAESVDRENWRGVLALSRLAIAESMPTNSASFLLGKSMRLLDRSTWPTLLTYADTRFGHTGAIYRATNWTCLGEVRGWPAWRHTVTGEMRGKKLGPRNLTTAEMHERGFEKLPIMPKIKFVHRLAS